MNKNIKLRRSVLYIPGANARALEKAQQLPADALILDLEDAVSPADKLAARQAVIDASGHFSHREVIIRVNDLQSPWGQDDLRSAAGSRADAVLLPKVNGPADVQAAAQVLRAAGAPPDMGLWVMAETPRGIQQMGAICEADPALQAVVMGTNDLAKDLRLPPDPERLGLLHALSRCILAARGQGLDIIDGVYVNLAEKTGFVRECEQGRKLGFDGKSLIHPRQIEPANAAFGVTAAELARSQAIVDAWDAAAAAGRGIAVLDGQMIEELHAAAARRVLALHAAIAADAKE